LKINDLYGSSKAHPCDDVIAGSYGTWEIEYEAGEKGIKPGGCIYVFLPAPGFSTRWEAGHVTVRCSNLALSVSVELNKTSPVSYHIFNQPNAKVSVWGGELERGDKIFVRFGDEGGMWNGFNVKAKAQTFSMKNASFRIFVDYMGNTSYPFPLKAPNNLVELDNPPSLNILPDKAAQIKLTVKDSPVGEKDYSFLQIAILDKYGNLVEDYSGRVRIEASSESIIINGNFLEFKAKDKGCKTVKIQFSQTPFGERIYACDLENELIGKSNPVPLGFDKMSNIYFGDLHVMTSATGNSKADKLGTADGAYKYAKDISGLDFCAVTDGKAMSHDSWEKNLQAAEAHNEDAFFSTTPAYEHDMKSGHKNIFFKDGKSVKSSAPTAGALWKDLEGCKAIAIAHHSNLSDEVTGEIWGPHDWTEHDPEIERLIEICQNRGSFETNRPERGVHFYGMGSSAQDALAQGLKLGFAGGTDNHRAQPGSKLMNLHGINNIEHNYAGITAVFAENLTREDIWNALYERKCYATTGVRMLLHVDIEGYSMGEIIPPDKALEFDSQRRIKIKVMGCNELERIDIVRNNVDIFSYKADGISAEFEYVDKEKLEEIPMPESDGGRHCEIDCAPFVFYYVRAIQKDNEMAWSSPIWFEKK
jgi:hypothetical protein